MSRAAGRGPALVAGAAVRDVLACGEDPEVPSDAELLAGRPYRLVAPASRAADRLTPLVLVLHGYASSAEAIETYYGFGGAGGAGRVPGRGARGDAGGAGNRAWNFSPIHFPPWTWRTCGRSSPR